MLFCHYCLSAFSYLIVSQPYVYEMMFLSSVFIMSVDFSLLKSLVCACSHLLASKSVSDAKTVITMVKQPVFLRSMSAPSDLEMIANQDLEFTHAPPR